jgi:Cft2 family RNA processing exonuclease
MSEAYDVGMTYLDPGYNTGTPPPVPSSGFDFAALAKGFGDAGAGTYASGAGTVLSLMGSLMAAKSAKKAARYSSAIAQRNAEAAAAALEIEAQQHDRNAAVVLQDVFLTRQAQEVQENQQRDQQEYVAGQTRAIVAASGLLMRGSPLAIYEAQLQQSERQILAGQYRAQLQERALRDQAQMESYAADVSRYGATERLRVGAGQARLARYAGDEASYASTVGAVGGLASGAARTYATYEHGQTQKKASLINRG